jgi:CDP-6-deoxy-D-xylo-4-hexulose-3-dehydrase
LKSYDKIFYPIEYYKNTSSFCLPFICASESIKNKLESILIECKVEYRPIVSGNLLRHPFLSKYQSLHNKTSFYNVEQLHTNGLYIGNNQFVDNKKLLLLEEILELL